MNTYEIFKSLVPSTLLHTQQSWIILVAKGSTWKISSGIILANFCRFAFLLCLYQLSFSFSSQALWPHIWWLFFFPFLLPWLDHGCFLKCWSCFWPSNPYDAIYEYSQAPHIEENSQNAGLSLPLSNPEKKIRQDSSKSFENNMLI